MRKMGLSGRRGKKSRRLVPVPLLGREEYTVSDLDTKVALIQGLIPLGLMHVQEALAAEVEELAGVRHARKASGGPRYRHGSNPGSVRLGGQRLAVRVPRVRADDGEILLRSYRELHTGGGEVDEVQLRRGLHGLSCANYEDAAAAVPGAIGLSRTSVSRSFVQASAARLKAFQERDLSGEDYVALFLDGKTFAEATMVIALGITMTGEKRLLGFIETDTENATVVSGFLRSLLARGLDIAPGILVVIDGSKGLRAAVRKVFAKHALVRRWLAARPRYHVHYTPPYASWLNQVEIWFHIITQRAIRRGTFASVRHLIEQIRQFVEHYNPHAQPFIWTATVDSILQKLKRLCEAIAGTQH